MMDAVRLFYIRCVTRPRNGHFLGTEKSISRLSLTLVEQFLREREQSGIISEFHGMSVAIHLERREASGSRLSGQRNKLIKENPRIFFW